jgi:adenosylmethionine---8-amino-7-oxononanoate aminotransferase
MNDSRVRELDARHIWHPYTQHQVAAAPIPIQSARGAHLYTADGQRLLDCISSWWVTLHGHCNETIAKAIAEQAARLEQVIFAGFTHEPAAALAAGLTGILPAGLSRVFYSDDGSTSIEVAIKMAFQYWRNRGERRGVIVALEGAYHGDTFGAMSVSARGLFNEPFADHLFEVARLPDPVMNDPVAALNLLLDQRRNEIAAIIVEPLLLGAGGMRMWSEDKLRALRAAAARAGILFIADEVLTGFGRTGPLFACQRAAVDPDIICLSKGLTGGFLPMGATVTTEEVFAAFLHDDRRYTLFHGHSYTANPIACASAVASISLLDESCAVRRANIERVHRTGLEMVGALNGVRNARVLGTVAAFDLGGDGEGYLSGSAVQLARECFKRGVYVRPLGNVVYLIPPYCIEEEELVGAYEVMTEILSSA